MLKFAPLAVFYHGSGNDVVHPTFFLTISTYSKLDNACRIYIGLHRAGAEELMLPDYELFSFDLARERRVQVRMVNGRALVAKLREGATITFMSLSIETTGGRTLPEEKGLCESAKSGWLNSRLFPMLRILQKHTSLAGGRST